MKAIWNNTIIAESEETVVIEGNHYFPPESLKYEYFTESDHHTLCPWKGTASYYHLHVNGETNQNAAWYYPQVSDLAKGIKGKVAFWQGITVVK